MTGYRSHSFDPNAYERQGPPMRPYNALQWTGLALVLAGICIDLVYFAGRLGWTPKLLGNPAPSTGVLLAGVALINSRREPASDPAPELAADRRRWMAIILTICAVVFSVAAIIDLRS